MPKFGSHIIFAEELARRRPDLIPSEINMNALRLGSIGPDTTLFMFDPATKNSKVREGFELVLRLMQDLQDLEDRVNAFIDTFDEPFDNIASWLTGSLYPELKETITITISAFMLLLKLGFTTAIGTIQLKNPFYDFLMDLPDSFKDISKIKEPTWIFTSATNFGFPFRYFGHPYTVDPPYREKPEPVGDYSNWWWMDLLHYRYPATFARRLLLNAKTPAERSYALGYLTHVAGDTAGHPFINALVRGPFRNHAQRHMVLETLADIWLWQDQRKADIRGSRLDKLIWVNNGDANEIASLIVTTMRQTYTSPMVPSMLANGYPTEQEWLFAYRSLSAYLKMSTATTVQKPTPPPEKPTDELKNVLKKLADQNPGSFPSLSGRPEDILRALWNWFSQGMTYLVMLATLPVAIVAALAALPGRWLLYLYRMMVYYLISSLRMMLCLSGWGYCSSQEFANFGYLKGFIRTPPHTPKTYPLKSATSKIPYYWLMSPEWLPGAAIEELPTTPHHPLSAGLLPDWMLNPSNQPNPDLIKLFGESVSPSYTNGSASELDTSIFGNAPDYAALLLDGAVNWYDFDLDGDRGNAYRAWEEMPPNERFL